MKPEPYRRVLGGDGTAAVDCSVLELDDQTRDYVTRTDSLCFWLPLSGRTEVRPQGTPSRYTFRGRRIAMLPPHSSWTGAWHGSMTCLQLMVTPSVLHEYRNNPIRYPEGGNMLVAEDEHIRYAMLAMHQTLLAPALSGQLFTQQIAHAVAWHYLQRYCDQPADTGARTRRLTPSQMDRLQAFIESRLQSKLTLDELAGVVSLSPAAFCRRFKQTTGIPPYQYVLRTRVELAKKALRQRRHSLSEIGLSLGFYDQSQFTNTFRRMVGLSPRAYRDWYAS